MASTACTGITLSYLYLFPYHILRNALIPYMRSKRLKVAILSLGKLAFRIDHSLEKEQKMAAVKGSGMYV
jgi:hypothetical protein